MSSATLLAFTGVALLCVATPGPTTLLALSNGSRFGLRAALPGMAGAVFSPMARTLVLNPLVPRFFAWTAGWPGMLERLIEGTGSAVDPRGREQYARLVRSPTHVAAALAMMAGWDLATLWRRLPELRTPLHLIVGDRDRTLPPDLAWQAAGRVRGTRVTTLSGLGHLAHEEQPGHTAALIRADL